MHYLKNCIDRERRCLTDVGTDVLLAFIVVLSWFLFPVMLKFLAYAEFQIGFLVVSVGTLYVLVRYSELNQLAWLSWHKWLVCFWAVYLLFLFSASVYSGELYSLKQYCITLYKVFFLGVLLLYMKDNFIVWSFRLYSNLMVLIVVSATIVSFGIAINWLEPIQGLSEIIGSQGYSFSVYWGAYSGFPIYDAPFPLYRMQGFCEEPGTFALAILPALCWFLFVEKSKIRSFVILLGVLQSVSVGGLLALFLLCVVFFIKRLINRALLVFLATLSCSLFLVSFYPNIIDLISGDFSYLAAQHLLSKGRIESLFEVYNYLVMHPIGTGSALGMMAVNYPISVGYANAMLESGMVGGIAYCIMFAVLFWYALKLSLLADLAEHDGRVNFVVTLSVMILLFMGLQRQQPDQSFWHMWIYASMLYLTMNLRDTYTSDFFNKWKLLILSSGNSNNIVFLIGIVIWIALTGVGLKSHLGSTGLFMLFSVISAAMWMMAWIGPKSYFYIFVSTFWMLGFWMKACIHLGLGIGFGEPVGDFSGTRNEWDHAIMVSLIAMLAMLTFRLGQVFFLKNRSCSYEVVPNSNHTPSWYPRSASWIWFITITMISAVAVVNYKWGVFQIGMKPNVLPYKLNAIISANINLVFPFWIATLIWWDTCLQRSIIIRFMGAVFEGVVSSVSILSRGTYVYHTVHYLLSSYYNRKAINMSLQGYSLLVFLILSGVIVTALLTTSIRNAYYSPVVELKTAHKSDPAELKVVDLVASREKTAKQNAANLKIARQKVYDLNLAMSNATEVDDNKSTEVFKKSLKLAKQKAAELYLEKIETDELMAAEIKRARLILTELKANELMDEKLKAAKLKADKLKDSTHYNQYAAELNTSRMKAAKQHLVKLEGVNREIKELKAGRLVSVSLMAEKRKVSELQAAKIKARELNDDNLFRRYTVELREARQRVKELKLAKNKFAEQKAEKKRKVALRVADQKAIRLKKAMNKASELDDSKAYALYKAQLKVVEIQIETLKAAELNYVKIKDAKRKAAEYRVARIKAVREKNNEASRYYLEKLKAARLNVSGIESIVFKDVKKRGRELREAKKKVTELKAAMPKNYSSSDPYAALRNQGFSDSIARIVSLVVDRWIGLEGVMAVSSYAGVGKGLFIDGWFERSSTSTKSIFNYIANSNYVNPQNSDADKYLFSSLPGLVAMLYYSGSFLVVFFGVLLFLLFIGLAEYSIIAVMKNPFVASFFAIYMANMVAQLGSFQQFLIQCVEIAFILVCIVVIQNYIRPYRVTRCH